jgi:hypothetical protein
MVLSARTQIVYFQLLSSPKFLIETACVMQFTSMAKNRHRTSLVGFWLISPPQLQLIMTFFTDICSCYITAILFFVFKMGDSKHSILTIHKVSCKRKSDVIIISGLLVGSRPQGLGYDLRRSQIIMSTQVENVDMLWNAGYITRIIQILHV